MTLTAILYPILTIGGMGLIFGLGLGFAGKLFHVDEDELVVAIRAALPGANCGACGFTGCDSFAAAVRKGEAKPNGCPVGGSETAEAVAGLMGVEASAVVKTVSFIKCGGGFSKSGYRYDYIGLDDCYAVAMMTEGGPKFCKYGCLGNGSCIRACVFDAIKIKDGAAYVDKEKCVACGLCISACPRHLIAMIPYDAKVVVNCNTKDTGKTVRNVCTVGCISCKMCEKACKHDAIKVDGTLAVIDYEKCTNCGECERKCPVRAITISQI